MTKRIYQIFHKLLQKLKDEREIKKKCRQKDGLTDEHRQRDRQIDKEREIEINKQMNTYRQKDNRWIYMNIQF